MAVKSPVKWRMVCPLRPFCLSVRLSVTLMINDDDETVKDMGYRTIEQCFYFLYYKCRTHEFRSLSRTSVKVRTDIVSKLLRLSTGNQGG